MTNEERRAEREEIQALFAAGKSEEALKRGNAAFMREYNAAQEIVRKIQAACDEALNHES